MHPGSAPPYDTEFGDTDVVPAQPPRIPNPWSLAPPKSRALVKPDPPD